MRTILSVMSLVLAGTLFGCSTVVVETTVPATSEHHGGILIPLTDKQAYVELVNGNREKKGKEYQTTLVAYLLESDHETPFTETATSVEIKIGTPKGDQVVALKPCARFGRSAGEISIRFITRAVRTEPGWW